MPAGSPSASSTPGRASAAEAAAKLFTPFFTTKAEGMGLGLSLCRTVIEQHGGALDFGPGPQGRGTEFRFTLPAPKAAPQQWWRPLKPLHRRRPHTSGRVRRPPSPPSSTRLPCPWIPALGIPVVYLVDDEDVVRDALAWLLRSRRLLSEGFASADAFDAWLAGRTGAGRMPAGRHRLRAWCWTCACPAPAAWCCLRRWQNVACCRCAGDLSHRPWRRAHGGGRGQARGF
jgi:hypothetical protein